MTQLTSVFTESPTQNIPLDPGVLDAVDTNAVAMGDSVREFVGNLNGKVHAATQSTHQLTSLHLSALTSLDTQARLAASSLTALVDDATQLSRQLATVSALADQVKVLSAAVSSLEKAYVAHMSKHS